MTAIAQTLRPLWPDWCAAARQMLGAMLGELQGLVITGGEASVRLSTRGICRGRWVAGFSPVGVSADRLLGLPQRLGMPAAGAQHFRDHHQRARQIYLALAQTDHQVVAKVYLEYPLPAVDLRAHPAQRPSVALQIESCKWRVDKISPFDSIERTEYWRVSGLDGPAMLELLRQTADRPTAVQAVYAGVAQVLEQALRGQPDWQGLRLLSVREPSQGRQGAGVRFYGSDQCVSAVWPALAPVFTHWGLPQQALSGLQELWNHQELGWLHAGLDEHGQPYLNVYGALNRAQTRAVLKQAGAAPFEQVNPLQEKSP
jgi:hypothetical protein